MSDTTLRVTDSSSWERHFQIENGELLNSHFIFLYLIEMKDNPVSFNTIKTELIDSILIIRLNRPENLNA